MKMSRRAKRMERHHKRSKSTPGFNLVSLMDIFTILVFFLLVNSGEGEILPSAKDMALPESISEQKPRQNIVVMVTDSEILVQGSPILRVSNIPDNGKLTIEPLKYALEAQNQRHIIKTAGSKMAPPEVTIMGSKEISYQLLKKVMATCTEAGFGKISLAVLQKPPQDS